MSSIADINNVVSPGNKWDNLMFNWTFCRYKMENR